MKLSEVLTNARGVINNGWCQKRSHDGHGNHCIMGAIGLAEMEAYAWGERQLFYEGKYPHEFLHDKLPEFGDFETLVHFNDDPTTTQQDVLNLFDKTIASAEEKGL